MGDEDLLFGETEDITDGIDGMQVGLSANVDNLIYIYLNGNLLFSSGSPTWGHF